MQINFNTFRTFWQHKTEGSIFISYRRSDTQGYAGRLSDSLEQYFGNNRVFRDIEDIKGGSEFAKDIEQKIHTADAVIVLIGPKWLQVSETDAKPRLHMEGDWVLKEIHTAIEKGVPIYPVLIDGAILPRASELPEKLQPILNYNAVNISDHHWERDVLSLGRTISRDIPTVNELKLFLASRFIAAALTIPLCLTTVFMALISMKTVRRLNGKTLFTMLPDSFERKIAAIPYVFILISVFVIIYFAPLIDPEKRRYAVAAALTGCIGTLLFFVLDTIPDTDIGAYSIYLGSVMITTLMFSLLTFSGFKPK